MEKITDTQTIHPNFGNGKNVENFDVQGGISRILLHDMSKNQGRAPGSILVREKFKQTYFLKLLAFNILRVKDSFLNMSGG